MGQRRSWNEIIPGIAKETKQLFEQLDEVVAGDKDEPLASLFDPPLQLIQPDQIRDEQEAERRLQELTDRLAEHGVVLDACQHFSALDSYRFLVEEVLPEAEIHPEMPSTGIVQYYATLESCQKCRAEFDCEE